MSEAHRPLILVVDDDPAVRELLKLQLAAEGYEVRLADDAIVAARSLMQAPPDLMLVDVAMPYMDGLDFVAELKREAAAHQLRIVFMTGHAEMAARVRALGERCLSKPFALEELLELVRRELRLAARLLDERL
jgi:DNA-binding response OmpR family regulator